MMWVSCGGEFGKRRAEVWHVWSPSRLLWGPAKTEGVARCPVWRGRQWMVSTQPGVRDGSRAVSADALGARSESSTDPSQGKSQGGLWMAGVTQVYCKPPYCQLCLCE